MSVPATKWMAQPAARLPFRFSRLGIMPGNESNHLSNNRFTASSRETATVAAKPAAIPFFTRDIMTFSASQRIDQFLFTQEGSYPDYSVRGSHSCASQLREARRA